VKEGIMREEWMTVVTGKLESCEKVGLLYRCRQVIFGVLLRVFLNFSDTKTENLPSSSDEERGGSLFTFISI